MKDTENLNQEMLELSPILAKMQKGGDGLQVPSNYFKNLPNETLSQLPIDNQEVNKFEKAKKNWLTDFLDNLNWLLQPRTALAFGSILLLVFAGIFLLNQPQAPQTVISLSDIPMEELESFFERNITEYDAEILVEGNENLMEKGMENDQDLDRYYDELLEESELEDLL